MSQYYSSAAGPIPRGNAFLVQTPETTGAVDQLFNQEQERKDRAQQQAIQLDQQMAKDMGQIRGVDIPEFTENYQKYKAIQMDIDNNPKYKRDTNALAQRRLEAQQALAATYGTMQDSKQAKQDQEDLNKAYYKNPDQMQDNFSDMHQALQNTPVGQLKNAKVNGTPVDLSDTNSFFDRTPRADLSPMLVKAAGKATNENDYTDTPDANDKLTTNRTTYKFGNDPLTFTNSLITQFNGKKGVEKTAAAAWNSIPPEAVAQVVSAYNQMPPDRLKRIGLTNPQSLSFKNAKSDAEKYAIFQGMKYALGPIGQETKPIINRQATNETNQANRQQNMRTQFGYSEDKIKLAASLGLGNKETYYNYEANNADLNEQQKDQKAQDFLGGQIKAAITPANKVSYTSTTGGAVEGYKLPLMDAAEKELYIGKGIHKLPPQETFVSTDGSSMTGVIKHTGDDGSVKVESVTKPTSVILMHYRDALSKGRPNKTPVATPTGQNKIPWVH